MDLICKRCGYGWITRYDRKPKTCPKCKSPFWEKELTPYWKSVRDKNSLKKQRNS